MSMARQRERGEKSMGEKSYWEERFASETHYEWFMSFDKIKHLILPHLNHFGKEARVLILGCGTSTLGLDLYREGFRNITNVDYSQVLIEKMSAKHPEMSWRVMDVRDMSDFSHHHFDVVIEKALVDIFVCDVTDHWRYDEAKTAELRGICEEVSRVLRGDGGRFISITYSPPHFRKQVYARKCFDWSLTATHLNPLDGAIDFYLYSMVRGEKLSEEDEKIEAGLDRPVPVAQAREIEENDVFAMMDV